MQSMQISALVAALRLPSCTRADARLARGRGASVGTLTRFVHGKTMQCGRLDGRNDLDSLAMVLQ